MICCFLTVVINVSQGVKAAQRLLRATANCSARTLQGLWDLRHSQNPPQLDGQGSQAKGAQGNLLRSTKGSPEKQQESVKLCELALHSCCGAQPATVAISAFMARAWGNLCPDSRMFVWTDIFPNVMFFKRCLKLKICSVPLRISLQISPRCLYVSSCFTTSFSFSPKTVQRKRGNYLAGRSLKPF